MDALGKDRRTAGAVYVEFLIAFLPLFVMFMSLVQLAFVEVANLVTKHAAVAAARAAMVVLPDDPSYYGGQPVNVASGARRDAIEAAAKARLMAVSTDPQITLRFPTSAGGDDDKVQFQRDDVVRVHLEFSYPCKIPIGSFFVCKSLDLHKVLKAEAAMPLQGAGYDYTD
jgi:hypothetical protein